MCRNKGYVASKVIALLFFTYFPVLFTPEPKMLPKTESYGEGKELRKVGTINIKEGNLVSINMIRGALTFHEGAVLDEDAITQTIKNLTATGYFKDVKVFKRNVGADKVDLSITFVEKSLLTGYEFVGNTQFSAKKLAEITGLLEAKTVSLHDIMHFRNLIINEYRKNNYLHPSVEVISRITKELPKKVFLRIEIKEGEKVRLKDVNFEGCNNVLASPLAATLQTKADWILGPLLKAGLFSEDALEVDKERIRRFYNDRGFYKACVTDVKVDKDEKNNDVAVTFVIDEGLRHSVRFIDIDGDEDFSKETLQNLFSISRGDVFSTTKLVESMERVKKLYGAKGYVFCSVYPKISPVTADGKPLVDIKIMVEKGAIFRINDVNISGNHITRDYVIRRNILVRSGMLANKALMDRSLARIEALGYFAPESIDWKISKVGEDLVDLDLYLKEVKTGQFAGAINLTPDRGGSGPTAKLDIGIFKRNFKGLGWDFAINTEFGENSLEKANVGFFNPAVLGSDFFFKSKACMDKVAYRDLSKILGGKVPLETTESIVLGTGCYLLPSTARLILGVELGLSRVEFTDSESKILPELSSAARLLYRDRFTTGSFNWLGISLGQNSLNHPLYPSNGWKWDSSCRVALPLFNNNYSMLKLELSGRYFLPIIGRDRLVFSALGKGGVVYSLHDKYAIPFKELLGLNTPGGTETVRGFKWGESGPEYRKFKTPLGGTKEMLFQFELTTPAAFGDDYVVNTPRAYLFYDIGAAWDTPLVLDTFSNEFLIKDLQKDVIKNDFKLRHTIGLGFRMTVPQPVRIEFGYKLDRKYRSNERPGEWHLSMNMPFDVM